ncbi:MAG: choice-of-anchor B family protein, partial [Saprospiraceae bacterium]|nr:choice-of-anchor B family protein [Saprospiraceae bacterium]
MRTGLILVFSLAAFAVVSQNTNVTFNAKVTFTGQKLANIWGYASGGQEYALVGGRNGMIIVDVTDPNNPAQIVQIPGVASDWREIRTYSHYAYIVSEGANSKIQIVDLNDLPDPNPDYHTVDGGSGITKGHALHIDEVKGYLYIYGSNLNGGRAQIYNLNNDPYNPSYVGFVNFIGYVHDGYVNNDKMYAAHIYTGQVAIVNLTNKTNPTLLGTFNTPNNFPHNTWLTGNTLLTTDEVSNSYLTSYDVTNPSNITELDRIQLTPGSGSIVHNTHILDNYAVTSWYKDGFAIVDVSRPANMVVVGKYDTYPDGSGNGFEGCWGVYPYLPSGTILASNIRAINTNNGELWVLTPTYVRGCYLEGAVTDATNGNPLPGANVQILTTSTSGVTNASGLYKIGQLQSGTFTAR